MQYRLQNLPSIPVPAEESTDVNEPVWRSLPSIPISPRQIKVSSIVQQKKPRETLKKPNYKSRASSDNNKQKKITLIIYNEPWISVNDVIYNLNRKFYG